MENPDEIHSLKLTLYQRCKNVWIPRNVHFVNHACIAVRMAVGVHVSSVRMIAVSDRECIAVRTVFVLVCSVRACIVEQKDELQRYRFELILLIAFLRMFDCLDYGNQTLVQSSESS